MKRLQAQASVSRWTLPFASVYGAMAWLGAGLVQQQMWLPFLLMALCVYVMAEMNNRNALLRIRSRMVSFSFLMMTVMNIGLLSDWRVALVQLSFALFLFVVFSVYQNDRAVGAIFIAFLSVGVASVAWVHVLYLVPVLLILLFRPLYALSFKVLSASVLGLIVPYWLMVVWCIYTENYNFIIAHFIALADYSGVLKYNTLTVGMTTVFSMLVIFMFTGIIHFIRKAYNEKIRVRMLYRILIIFSLLLVALIAVVPCHANYLIPMLEVTVAPLIAHFVVFTRTKVTNWAFVVGLLTVICVMLFEICLTSLYNTVL